MLIIHRLEPFSAKNSCFSILKGTRPLWFSSGGAARSSFRDAEWVTGCESRGLISHSDCCTHTRRMGGLTIGSPLQRPDNTVRGEAMALRPSRNSMELPFARVPEFLTRWIRATETSPTDFSYPSLSFFLVLFLYDKKFLAIGTSILEWKIRNKKEKGIFLS